MRVRWRATDYRSQLEISKPSERERVWLSGPIVKVGYKPAAAFSAMGERWVSVWEPKE